MELDDSRGDEAPQVDEEERQELVASRRSLLKRVGLGAAALSLPASVVASPAFGGVSEALASQAFIKSHPKWKFVFVNHVTTNPFFVPTHLRRAGRVLAARLRATSGRDRPTSTSARW